MAVEELLYSTLTGTSAITDIVGDRIHSDIREQGDDIPYIVFERSDTEYSFTMETNTPAYIKHFFDVVCLSTTREATEILAQLIISTLLDVGFFPEGKNPDYEDQADEYISSLQFSYITPN